MGIYDRDYYREESKGISLGGDWTMVTNIVFVTVAFYIANMFSSNSWLENHMALSVDTLTHPLEWYRFLAYGFAHDPHNVWHILGNMFILWMFGRSVEAVYGRKEFLWLYLVMIVISGLAWALGERFSSPNAASVVGASGAVAGMVVLFALNFPKQTVLLGFILPIPAWVMAVMLVLFDIAGAVKNQGHVAFTAHLAGAAFAFAYYRSGWRISRFIPAGLSLDRVWKRMKGRPKLRVHDPERKDEDLSHRVDEILEKISRKGEESLTREERRILETASRRYQRRRE